MLNFKDRKPAAAGTRSFFPLKYFVIILSVVLIFFGWYASRLVVAVIPEGNTGAFAFRTYPGDRWNISFTHSVEKTEWDEYFRVNGAEDMTMTHTQFESLGWGYPYSSADGRFSKTADGKFKMDMNRPYKEVAIRISEQAMQHIRHGSEDYDLIPLFGQGRAIKIKVMYRYQYWLKHCF